MTNSLSKSQINKLGERLRSGATEGDLRLLSEYRDSHDLALEETIQDIVSSSTSLVPVGRPKSNQSIIEKLRRQSTRLGEMQDIAGCRLVVDGPLAQQKLCDFLVSRFVGSKVYDRRVKPSHGYRAVHIGRQHPSGRPVEIQVRTELQDLWAQCSERLADMHGIEVKYGGGPPKIVALLDRLSEFIADIEQTQMKISEEIFVHRVRDAVLPSALESAYLVVDTQLDQLRYLLGMLANLDVSSPSTR